MKIWFWFTNEKGECVVLFTAPKMVKDWVSFYHHWCRDAGTPCMNMLCLKSCTAHTGFPCKDHSAKIQFVFFLFFLVIKTMSVNLSIGLCCVISVIVCKCCGLSVAMPMAKSPTPPLQRNYFNRYTDTQYQPKIVIHNSGIYLVENYFLHSAPLFSFSNSRSAKSKTWLRAVALLQTWHLNAMRQHLNAMRMIYFRISVWCRMSWRCMSFGYVLIKSRALLQQESHPQLIPGNLAAENHSKVQYKRLI